jgi:hypothetical protein
MAAGSDRGTIVLLRHESYLLRVKMKTIVISYCDSLHSGGPRYRPSSSRLTTVSKFRCAPFRL